MAVKLKQRYSPKVVNQNHKKPWWALETVRPDSHILRFDQVGAGWERWIMLSSDRHWDNIHSEHDLMLRHLEMAKERDALIVDAGDFFCAMQGRGDPRASGDALRPEHKTDRYLDSLVDTAGEFFAPYARHFAIVGHGNHETKVLKHYGTDLIDRVTAKMRDAGGVTVPGAYMGWVTMRFAMQKTVSLRKVLHYYHGSGGGGPVTRGVIQSNRMAVNLPDAHIVMSGHTHDSWVVNVVRQRVSLNGVPFKDMAYHVRIPTYKDEFKAGMGYAVERGMNPKPLGCYFLRMRYHEDNIELLPIPEVVAEAGRGEQAPGLEYMPQYRDYYPREYEPDETGGPKKKSREVQWDEDGEGDY